jgi:hypothetical protein
MHKAHQGKAVQATDLFYDYVESKTGKFSNRSVNRIVAGLKSELIEKCCFEADSIVELRGLICRWMKADPTPGGTSNDRQPASPESGDALPVVVLPTPESG